GGWRGKPKPSPRGKRFAARQSGATWLALLIFTSYTRAVAISIGIRRRSQRIRGPDRLTVEVCPIWHRAAPRPLSRFPVPILLPQPQQIRGDFGSINAQGIQYTRTGRSVVPAPHVGREPP